MNWHGSVNTRVYCVTLGKCFIIMGWAWVSSTVHKLCNGVSLSAAVWAWWGTVKPNSYKSPPEVGYHICTQSGVISSYKALYYGYTDLHSNESCHLWVPFMHGPFLKRNSPLYIVSTVCKQPTLSAMVCSCINLNLAYMLQLDWSSLWICFT